MTLRTPLWLLIGICFGAACVALYFSWAKEFIAVDRCLDAGGSYEERWQTCNLHQIEDPAEKLSVYTGPVYTGALDGQQVHLQIRDDFQTYRMVKDGLRMEGDVNTEKGFEQDHNAVVYVLDWKTDAPLQTRLLLDQHGGIAQLRLIGVDLKLQKDAALRAEATY